MFGVIFGWSFFWAKPISWRLEFCFLSGLLEPHQEKRSFNKSSSAPPKDQSWDLPLRSLEKLLLKQIYIYIYIYKRPQKRKAEKKKKGKRLAIGDHHRRSCLRGMFQAGVVVDPRVLEMDRCQGLSELQLSEKLGKGGAPFCKSFSYGFSYVCVFILEQKNVQKTN